MTNHVNAISVANIQPYLVDIASDFGRAVQLINGAIDPVDIDAIEQASQIFTVVVTKVAAVRAALPAS